MKVLQKIARTYVDIGEDSPALEIAIETLRAGISREQKSLLLKIIDEYSDRIDYAADRNFKYGFRMGVHLGRELFSQNKKYRVKRPFPQAAAGAPAAAPNPPATPAPTPGGPPPVASQTVRNRSTMRAPSCSGSPGDRKSVV